MFTSGQYYCNYDFFVSFQNMCISIPHQGKDFALSLPPPIYKFQFSFIVSCGFLTPSPFRISNDLPYNGYEFVTGNLTLFYKNWSGV